MPARPWRRLWRSELPWRAAAATVLAVTVGLLGSGLMAAWAAESSQSPTLTQPIHEANVKGMDAVTKGLMCTCGCNLTVASCEGAMTCSVARQMKADIAEKLSSGMSPNAVLAAFATDYGEQVLAAPTKHGFNLTAWVLPFAALALGALVVAVALRRWRTAAAVEEPAPDAPDPTYAALVDEEVRRGV